MSAPDFHLAPLQEAQGSPAQPPPTFLDPARAMTCIHCGLCLSSCPTYLETGDENNSPRGRIHLMRALQDGRLPLTDAPVRHLDLCLGCRACEAACPSGVEYGALLEATRDHVEARHARSPWQQFLRKVVIRHIFPHPERMSVAVAPALALRRTGLDRYLPWPKAVREALALLPVDASPDTLPMLAPAASQPARGRVGFIRGCVMSVLFGPTHESSVRLLTQAGFDVVTPPEQGCCGALHAHGGQLDLAREAARRNIAVFESLQVDAIVINAAGCGSTLKEYHHLLENDPAWAQRALQFQRKVRDLSEWLNLHGVPGITDRPAPGRPEDPLVTFHDACHLAHAQRIAHPPRRLVRAVAGSRFVELPEADVCCGSAGSYNLTEPAMAARLQQRKVDNILKSGARIVVSTNPGCLMQIRAGLDAFGATDIETLHLADYLARALPAAADSTRPS